MYRNRLLTWGVGAAMLALVPAYGRAQQAAEVGPKVGDMAPDFQLVGATSYGILRDQIKLENYRGNTVVLAFFFKARTRG